MGKHNVAPGFSSKACVLTMPQKKNLKRIYREIVRRSFGAGRVPVKCRFGGLKPALPLGPSSGNVPGTGTPPEV